MPARPRRQQQRRPGAGIPASAAGCADAAPLRGTRRGDRLSGTADADLILGRRGRDRLNGLAGEDCIFGGPGATGSRPATASGTTVNCGRGRDRVRADAIDSLRRCERRR